MDCSALASYSNLADHNLQTETAQNSKQLTIDRSYLEPNNSVLLKNSFFCGLTAGNLKSEASL